MNSSQSLLIRRSIRWGFATFRRERGWGAALAIFTGVFLVLSVLLLLAAAVWQLRATLQSDTAVRLELQDSAAPQRTQDFLSALRDLSPVQRVSYITREQAYEEERMQDPQFIGLLEQFKINNPFRDTVAVTLRSLQDYPALKKFIEQPQWADVVDVRFLTNLTGQEQDAHDLLSLTDAGGLLLLGFLGVTGVILLAAAVELVRRRSQLRREEIAVEHVLGAPRSFLILPLATETALLLWGAALLGALLLGIAGWLLATFLPDLLRLSQAFLHLDGMVVTVFLLGILLVELVLIPFLSYLGAWMGVRRVV